ncbi:Gfo/Idh/MocA family protein [Thiomicrospira pelophila]|uniref:Gfo/Idh/MocA family protein n=1 Tax=Thiomicrospira pelophila TaxID=934 RepID=UPI0004A6D38B|nr:Gfo/Idh/MocA family oxidoreductase [Thiomicrospira pelophila]
MNKIKIGILSCASIARRFVIPAIKQTPSFELYGIASRNPEKAKQAASDFETKVFESYDELINATLDAVYIPLPNSLHYEWIKKSLNNNLHVLVEKSMTCSLEQTQELNTLAQSKGLVLIENFQFRFHTQMAYIQQVLKSGKLGELRNIRASFGFPPFPDADNIRYHKQLGGGALLDAGAYPIKISQIFLGNDIYVDSSSLAFPADKQVDIWGSAFVKQENGKLTSQIAFGFDHFYQNNLELWGTKGKLTATRIFTAGPGVKPEVIIETQEGKESIVLPEDNHFVNMLNHFANCINTKQNLNDEYHQNINQARLIGELSERAK